MEDFQWWNFRDSQTLQSEVFKQFRVQRSASGDWKPARSVRGWCNWSSSRPHAGASSHCVFCFGYFAWCIICQNSGFILYPWWSFNKSIQWVQRVFSSEIKSRSLFNGNYRITQTRRASVPDASISNLVLFSVLVLEDSRLPSTLDDVGEFEICITLLYNCLSLVVSFWPYVSFPRFFNTLFVPNAM